jgi:hypothetical protein
MEPSGAESNHMRCGSDLNSTTTYDSLFEMSSPKKPRFLLLVLKEHMILSETRIHSMFIHHAYQKNIIRERRFQIYDLSAMFVIFCFFFLFDQLAVKFVS